MLGVVRKFVLPVGAAYGIEVQEWWATSDVLEMAPDAFAGIVAEWQRPKDLCHSCGAGEPFQQAGSCLFCGTALP